jgi:cyclopropane fatty-acyl-phospholipid synthase-like methyltransferase
MNSNDYTRILDFYESSFYLDGSNDSQSVHWSSEESQYIRFEVLHKIGDLNKKKVLDVGCGLGELYKFFLKKEIDVEYVGIDIIPMFVERARARFPGTSFTLGNAETLTETYDYIVASGAFTFKVENAKEYYFALIKHLFLHAREGLAFNMLNIQSHTEDDESHNAYDVEEVMAFCKTLSPHVVLVDDYLSYDFTIYMYTKKKA